MMEIPKFKYLYLEVLSIFFQCAIEVTAYACSSSSREICEVSHNFGASLLPRQLCVRMRERQVDVDVAVPLILILNQLLLLITQLLKGVASVKIIPPCFILIYSP